MPDARAATQCDDCLQVDDHPKVHYGVDTYHHDCLPPRARRDVASNPMADVIIRACERGLRGPELLAHITALHEAAVEQGHDAVAARALAALTTQEG